MQQKLKFRILALFLVLVLTLPLVPNVVFAADSWDGFTGGTSATGGGQLWIDGFQAVQYTIVDRNTGETRGNPVVFINEKNQALANKILTKNPSGIYGFIPKSKIAYMRGTSLGDTIEFKATLVPSSHKYASLIVPNFVGGKASVASIEAAVKDPDSRKSGGFLFEFATLFDQATAEASGGGTGGDSFKDTMNRNNFKILVEPVGIWAFTDSVRPKGFPSILAMTATEMGLVEMEKLSCNGCAE